MALTENGISTTRANGQFACESFTSRLGRKEVVKVQWDYRDAHGVLHSGIAASVNAAKKDASVFGYPV